MVECAVLGLLLSRWPIGRALLIVAVGAMTACLLLPINSWAIRPLEDRFPAVTAPPEKVDGIVVLGGAIDELTSRDRGTPTLTAAADRLTTFVVLAQRYPQAKLIFTGGSGAIEQGVSNEAKYARILLEQLGLAADRVVFEDASRTTWENAVNTYALVKPQPTESDNDRPPPVTCHGPRACSEWWDGPCCHGRSATSPVTTSAPTSSRWAQSLRCWTGRTMNRIGQPYTICEGRTMAADSSPSRS